MNIELGDMARDTVSGLQGIVVADCMWMNGCRRLTLASRDVHNGKPAESHTFDEEQVELVTKHVLQSKGRERLTHSVPVEPLRRTGSGGPPIEPASRPANVR